METYKKIDSDSLEITTTTKHVVTREQLVKYVVDLEQRKIKAQEELDKVQGYIDEINANITRLG